MNSDFHVGRDRSLLPALAAAALLLYIVLFWRLGAASLWDPDEGHYAVTTYEMLASRNWLVPTFNDQPFFDKPIFFHWLQGLPILALGPTEAALRVVPALSALLLVAITAWFAATISGRGVGFVAGVVLGCNPSVFALARYAILDMPFVACLFGGASVLAVAIVANRPRLQKAGFVLLACATCLKGPVALVLCGLTALLAALVSSRVRHLLARLAFGRGLLLILAISAPWFIYMLWRFGGAFVEGYFLNENLRLFGQPLYVHQPGWWFYIEVVMLAMLPWSSLVLGRALDQCRQALRRQTSMDPYDVLLWSWIVAIVGFFSFSHFKLDHYVFPAAPALAVICARAWASARTGAAGKSDSTWTRFGISLIGPTLMVGGVTLTVLTMARLDLARTFWIVPAVVIIIGLASTVRYFQATDLPQAPLLPLLAMGVIYIGALFWIVPKLEEGKVIPDIASWVQQHARPSDRIATFRLDRWNTAFRFYVGRRIEPMTDEGQAWKFLASHEPYFCVMTEPSFNALRDAGVILESAYRREGLWATSGNALWRTRRHNTVFIVATGPPRELP